uniref:Uncharacterized protein n=1 Tax=Anguilla anguilla TaxID=7936 RepID=A0A0E9S8I9_ANGAN
MAFPPSEVDTVNRTQDLLLEASAAGNMRMNVASHPEYQPQVVPSEMFK